MSGRSVSQQADHQLAFEFGGSSAANANARPVRTRDNRKHLVVIQPSPPLVKDGTYQEQARAGVPSHRDECRDGPRPCNRPRCFWFLPRVDAGNRAGRPGLSKVPRGEMGRTIAVEGDMGEERAGTTLVPVWLELERTCVMQLTWDESGKVAEVAPVVPVRHDGTPLFTFRKRQVGTWDLMRAKMRAGEKMLVYDADEKHIANAFLMPDESIGFDTNPYAVFVTLVRERPIATCGLDLIEQCGRMTNEQIGDAIGRHRTLAAREVKQAIEHAVEKGKEMGIEAEDLVATLTRWGEEE